MLSLLLFITPCLSLVLIQSKESEGCMGRLQQRKWGFGRINTWFGGLDCCDGCEDEYGWELEQHPVEKDFYKIIDPENNKAIASGSTPPISNDNNDEDSKYWQFVFDNDDDPSYFKLRNLANNKCLIHQYDTIDISGKEFPNTFPVEITVSSCTNNDNAYWKFLENYEIITVDFDINAGVLLSNIPWTVGTGTCDNSEGGSSSQTIGMSASATKVTTSSFERSHGFEITVGTTFKAKVPLVAEGEISVEASTSHDFTYGEESSMEYTDTVTWDVTCAPGEIIELECVVFKSEIDVPYTIGLLGSISGITIESSGTFTGTQSSNIYCSFEHKNANGDVMEVEQREFP